jgi:hypothetical protein
MNNSLAEPFKDGDPRPEEGLFNSYAKEYRIKVWDAMYGDTRNPDGTLKSSKGDSKSKEPVTTDVKLMQEYGSSILQHMDDAGLTVGSTDEEIQEELAAWFSDNSTDPNVPALVGVDNDIVIRTIRKFLSEGS